MTEIEVVIARPELANEWGKLNDATHSMFIAPLLADVNPAGFAARDPWLSRPPLNASFLRRTGVHRGPLL